MVGVVRVGLVFVSLLLSGCASHQLHRQANRLIYSEGIEQSDFQLLSYCEFRVPENPREQRIWTSKGIVALTNSDLYLISLNQKHLFSNDLLTIPIGEFDGIALQSTYIQLKYEEDVIIIQLEPGQSQAETDQARDKLVSVFVRNQVPEYLPSTVYQVVGATERRRANFDHSARVYKGAPQPESYD